MFNQMQLTSVVLCADIRHTPDLHTCNYIPKTKLTIVRWIKAKMGTVDRSANFFFGDYLGG